MSKTKAPPTKRQLLARLEKLAQSSDAERAHGDADDLLLEFINDPAITAAYARVPKWYA